MAKKSKKVSLLRTNSPRQTALNSVNTGMIGGSIPSINSMGAGDMSGFKAKTMTPSDMDALRTRSAVDPDIAASLRAKMPADFDSIKSKMDEEEMEFEMTKDMDMPVKKAPKKKATKKVSPKKAPVKKKVKPGKITYISTDASDQIKRVSLKDSPKY